MTTWLFVHSPLLGPSSWAPIAERAATEGHQVVVPDLRIDPSWPRPIWRRMVDEAARAVDGSGPLVILGHSGAGALMPSLGRSLASQIDALVFVDANLPPATGSYSTPPDLRPLIEDNTDGKLLHNWFDWWPEGVVEGLIPDEEIRDSLRAEAPRIPPSYYDDPIPVSDGWTDLPCCYVRLSNAYDADLTEARRRGWPVVSVDSDHLGLITTPDLVFASISGAIGRV